MPAPWAGDGSPRPHARSIPTTLTTPARSSQLRAQERAWPLLRQSASGNAHQHHDRDHRHLAIDLMDEHTLQQESRWRSEIPADEDESPLEAPVHAPPPEPKASGVTAEGSTPRPTEATTVASAPRPVAADPRHAHATR